MSEPNTIDILDLGINNISSVVSGLRAAAPFANVKVVSKSSEASVNPRLTVLPGNGSFGAGMAALENLGLSSYLSELSKAGEPILGICLGLQLFFDASEEATGVKGLGLISGQVRRLPMNIHARTRTNIGWASVSRTLTRDSKLNLDPLGRDVYFVHSYYVDPELKEETILKSSYNDFEFPAAIQRDMTVGVQFHPEKSSSSGIAILRSVLDWSLAKS